MKKKFLLLASVFAFFFGITANAGNAELFTMDEEFIQEQMAGLTELEQIVTTHEGITLSAMKSGKLDLSAGLQLKINNLFDGLQLMEPPLGIPSFLWGCVLGWVGILVVYLVSEDKEETKKALYGCLVGWGAGFLLYILIWVVIVGNSFWYF